MAHGTLMNIDCQMRNNRVLIIREITFVDRQSICCGSLLSDPGSASVCCLCETKK